MRATARSWATTTSGGCRRPTTRTAVPIPEDRYIRNRPVFRAGAPGSLISPNLAGRLAADFALCYQLDRVDRACAGRGLPQGRRGRLRPCGYAPRAGCRPRFRMTSIPRRSGATTSSGERPSSTTRCQRVRRRPERRIPTPCITCGQAAHWAHAYITGPYDAADTLNLYDVTGLAHFELYRAIEHAGNPSDVEVTKAQLLGDLRKQLDKARCTERHRPFGFGFPWDTFDTTSHGAGLVVMAAEYDELTGTNALRRLRLALARQHPRRQCLGHRR